MNYKVKIGDILVFTGNKTKDPHYDNFEVGEQYKIKSIDVLYDSDEYFESNCVTFEDHKYGSLTYKLPEYFVLLEDYRNDKIEQIL